MNRLKILIAGTANPHVPAYLSGVGRNVDSVEIVAVSDFDEARLKRAKTMLGRQPQVQFYDDYREMFRRHADADAVMIGSDNRDHFEMFREAMARRFHLYMMKVMSMDEGECREMIELARQSRRVVQCELELHFHPQFRKARELVRSGALGELTGIYLSNISQSPCNYFPNWGDPELSYGKRVPLRPNDRVCRGGAITDHPHPFDLVRWITGLEFVTVSALSAANQRDHLEVEDHAAITGVLQHDIPYLINPSYSNLEERVPARRLLWPKSLECNLKLTGTRGYFSADFFDQHVYVVGNRCASPDRLIVDGAARLPAPQSATLIGSFVDTIAGRRPRPETTPEDDFAAIRVMNAAYESIRRGESVTLPAED